MDYDRDGVQARKAWFFLPDGWVALGAGIGTATSDPVTTSINQCLLKSEVVILQDGHTATLTDAHLTSQRLQGVHHDGVGYYLLEPQRAVVSTAPQSGTWTSIRERSPDTRAVSQDVFGLWIEHGKADGKGSYAYRVVPGLAAEELASTASTSPVTLLANSARLQAVAHPPSRTVQAVFYEAGRLTFQDGWYVEPDSPCMLLLRRAEDGTTLSIADPTQSLQHIQVRLLGQMRCADCTYDPTQGVSTVTLYLATGPYAGQTAQTALRSPPS
jgi:chondroitin AC lyase